MASQQPWPNSPLTFSTGQIDDVQLEPEEPSAVDRLGALANGARPTTRYRLPYIPVVPGSVCIGDVGATDDSRGKLTRFGSVLGEINYRTGEIRSTVFDDPIVVSWAFNPAV